MKILEYKLFQKEYVEFNVYISNMIHGKKVKKVATGLFFYSTLFIICGCVNLIFNKDKSTGFIILMAGSLFCLYSFYFKKSQIKNLIKVVDGQYKNLYGETKIVTFEPSFIKVDFLNNSFQYLYENIISFDESENLFLLKFNSLHYIIIPKPEIEKQELEKLIQMK